MVMSVHLHASAGFPQGKGSLYTLNRSMGGPQRSERHIHTEAGFKPAILLI